MFGPFLVAIAGFAGHTCAQRPGGHAREELACWAPWLRLDGGLSPPAAGVHVADRRRLLVSPPGAGVPGGHPPHPLRVYDIVGDSSLALGAGPAPAGQAPHLGHAPGRRRRHGTAWAQRSCSDPSGQGPGAEAKARAETAGHGPLVTGEAVRPLPCCAPSPGLLLTLSVEFVYLVDNFGVRMNTIFKFYFQAWVLMAIASAFGDLLARPQAGAGCAAVHGFLVAFWLLFAMGMVYPVLGNCQPGRQLWPCADAGRHGLPGREPAGRPRRHRLAQRGRGGALL
jgi:hypothetical protein